MEHDLSLAGAERVETPPYCSHHPITLTSGTIASETGIDGVKQILISEWLCKELYRTALHCLHSHRHVGVGCDEDDRHLPVCGDKFALKIETASPRHSYVEHQASRTIRRIGLEKIGNRRKLSGIQADCPQQSRDRIAKFGIIIDNQDTGICLTHSRYPALGKRILA
ncbi:hypothetical protein BJA01nite_38230 [Bradyrhizobium japonicum]|nr:hypothetical protein BJ6T_33280 [Bradyrhizobium japonicum USDA 6]GEC46181.1 hypothetical protein BJA01nite_38230 [Bradyrhizobium japonicum]